MTDLERLAEAVERALPDMQGKLLEDAWEAMAQHSGSFRCFACAPSSGFGTNAGRFAAALEARAYESAAIMLVPDGMGYGFAEPKGGISPSGFLFNTTGLSIERRASTPALALCAAALAAKSREVG